MNRRINYRKFKPKNIFLSDIFETDPNNIEENDDSDIELWRTEGKYKLEALKKTQIWDVLNQCIEQLIETKKIIETTARQNTLTYLIGDLRRNNLLSTSSLNESTGIKIVRPRKCTKKSYEKFKKHSAWRILNKSIEDLIENRDLTELVWRRYILGYIINQLLKCKLIII
ncbi:MAG TPA: hypothetical protein VFF04_04320 [Candidatus Babeliales bacterium]|nr:hypothetical protein [Candidatus Babeliales bacterium]